MYMCLDCLNIFDCPKHYVENHGFTSPPFENWDGCPKCGGTYIKAKECSQCGKYITTDYNVLKNGDYVCENCFIRKRIEEIGRDFN